MLFPWQFIYFVFQHLKCFNQLGTRVRRENHLVNVASVRSAVGIGKLSRILLHFFLKLSFGIFCFGNFFFEDNFRSPFGTHHCDFGSRPGIVEVCPNVLGVHHIVSTAIGFAGDHCDARYCSFRKGVE